METTPGTPASPQPEETPSTVVETSATEATASEPAVVTEVAKPATPAPELNSPAPAAAPQAPKPAPEPRPVASATPPAPAPAPEAPKPAPEPGAIATTVSVPADPGASAAEGGEYQLLLDKLSALLGDTDLNAVWQQSQRPLKLLGVAMVVIVTLQLTGAVLDTLGGIPMLPRMLQLVGLTWLVMFGSKRLLRSEGRQQVVSQVSGAWNAFVGKG